ncbi:5'-nucleotidase domain-containing protein [Tanacetum coccineum]
MASVRKLFPVRSSLLFTKFQATALQKGFWGGCYGQVASLSTDQSLDKLLVEENVPNVGCLDSNDDVAKIREKFDLAKQRFLNIPDALEKMPKMNPKGIYVNKNLRLDSIQVYGFDYDYTLAHYSPSLQNLIYDMAKQHLVNELKYPDGCLASKYDQSFPIRGLYYDKLKGCLLKLDFFGSIEPDGCYFGRRKGCDCLHPISPVPRSGGIVVNSLVDKKLKRSMEHDIMAVIKLENYCRFDGFLLLSEVCLIADIVQYFVDAKLEFDASYVYQDVRCAIQHVHLSGLVHRGILSDPQRYLVKNDQFLSFLKMLKENGKKLFLMTNSPYYFVDGGMRYMLEDSLGGDSWRELFEVVIAKANKPDFYTSEHPFRCYDVEKDNLAFSKVDSFHPDKIYYHGCLKTFLQITKWNGPEVIYFGDHLFSDLRGPSKAGWRTAAIIHELEHEIKIQNEDSYRFAQAKFHIIQELLGKLHSTVSTSYTCDAFKSLLAELNEERQNARRTMRNMFNESFGATFLTDTGQESAFAYHIHQYADVYTSKPENFMFYQPEAWLHVPYDVKIMPHHLKRLESRKYKKEEKGNRDGIGPEGVAGVG